MFAVVRSLFGARVCGWWRLAGLPDGAIQRPGPVAVGWPDRRRRAEFFQGAKAEAGQCCCGRGLDSALGICGLCERFHSPQQVEANLLANRRFVNEQGCPHVHFDVPA